MSEFVLSNEEIDYAENRNQSMIADIVVYTLSDIQAACYTRELHTMHTMRV